jgi:hypothetical protein
MGRITGGRKLSHADKLSCRSLRSVVRSTEGSVSSLVDEGLKFGGRRLTLEAYINAAVSYMNGLPVAARAEAVSPQLRRLEALLQVEGESRGRGEMKPAAAEEPRPAVEVTKLGTKTFTRGVEVDPLPAPAKKKPRRSG